MTIYLLLQNEILGSSDATLPDSLPASPDKSRTSQTLPTHGSKTALTILTLSAVAAIFAAAGSNATIALGLSYAVLEALAFLLVERARAETQSGRQNGGSVIYSTNGLLSQPAKPTGSSTNVQITVIRDVSLAAAISTSVAALALENFTFGGLAYWGVIGQVMGEKWVVGQGILTRVIGVVMVGVHLVKDGTALIMVSADFSSSFVYYRYLDVRRRPRKIIHKS